MKFNPEIQSVVDLIVMFKKHQPKHRDLTFGKILIDEEYVDGFWDEYSETYIPEEILQTQIIPVRWGRKKQKLAGFLVREWSSFQPSASWDYVPVLAGGLLEEGSQKAFEVQKMLQYYDHPALRNLQISC